MLKFQVHSFFTYSNLLSKYSLISPPRAYCSVMGRLGSEPRLLWASFAVVSSAVVLSAVTSFAVDLFCRGLVFYNRKGSVSIFLFLFSIYVVGFSSPKRLNTHNPSHGPVHTTFSGASTAVPWLSLT